MDRVSAHKRSRQHHTCSPSLDQKEREKEKDSKLKKRRRTIVGELKTPMHTWGTIRKLAHTKQQWKTLVAALQTSRHKSVR